MRQFLGIAHGGAEKSPVAGEDLVAVDFHFGGQLAVNGVVLKEMGVGLYRAEIVDRDHFDVPPVMLDDRAQNQAADAAKPIDGNTNGHECDALLTAFGA